MIVVLFKLLEVYILLEKLLSCEELLKLLLNYNYDLRSFKLE